MANVGYADINTADAATLLGVSKWSIQQWCKNGCIQYINVGEGDFRPRYMFTEDEVERVRKLMEKYGHAWRKHSKEGISNKNQKSEVAITTTINPEDYIPDNTDETISYIKKIRSLKIQRDKLLAELDTIDEAIKTMRQKVIDSI